MDKFLPHGKTWSAPTMGPRWPKHGRKSEDSEVAGSRWVKMGRWMWLSMAAKFFGRLQRWKLWKLWKHIVDVEIVERPQRTCHHVYSILRFACTGWDIEMPKPMNSISHISISLKILQETSDPSGCSWTAAAEYDSKGHTFHSLTETGLRLSKMLSDPKFLSKAKMPV